MKNLFKLLFVSVGLYSASSMAMTKKECKDAGGDWSGTILTGTCTQKLTATLQNKDAIILLITKEECKKQGGTVSNGNCITVTHYKAGQKTKTENQ